MDAEINVHISSKLIFFHTDAYYVHVDVHVYRGAGVLMKCYASK